MAKLTKAQRSKAAAKGARTRKRNHLKRSSSARKGAAHRKGARKGVGGKKRTAKQRAATARMLAANRAKRGGRKSTSIVRRKGGRKARRTGGAVDHEARRAIGQLQQLTAKVILPAVAVVYHEHGMKMPSIGGPRQAMRRLGSG